jgi:hypothetical protein
MATIASSSIRGLALLRGRGRLGLGCRASSRGLARRRSCGGLFRCDAWGGSRSCGRDLRTLRPRHCCRFGRCRLRWEEILRIGSGARERVGWWWGGNRRVEGFGGLRNASRWAGVLWLGHPRFHLPNRVVWGSSHVHISHHTRHTLGHQLFTFVACWLAIFRGYPDFETS